MKEDELAGSITKSIYRKIKTEKITKYNNVIDLIKVFEIDIKGDAKTISQKQKDNFALFSVRNIDSTRILTYLLFALKKKYS